LQEKQRLSDREIQEARSSLREERKEIKNEKNELVAENEQEDEIPELKEGDKVKIKSVNKKGKVIDLDLDKEEAVVQSGVMKVTVDLKKLARVENKESKSSTGKVNISNVKQQKVSNISTKLDLRGMRAGEARDKLLKYLDDVILSNLNQVEIVHGKGTGVLRDVVDETLKNYPSVKEYRLGKPKEGGSGVTIVKLES
ncbi:MAG: Smr/MutS family protein, partial [Halanaerobacter sp.]